jgi:hypothetical protein
MGDIKFVHQFSADTRTCVLIPTISIISLNWCLAIGVHFLWFVYQIGYIREDEEEL